MSSGEEELPVVLNAMDQVVAAIEILDSVAENCTVRQVEAMVGIGYALNGIGLALIELNQTMQERR